MKKITLTLLVILICVLTASLILTGCAEKKTEPEVYDVVAVNTALVTIEPSVTTATAGTAVNVKVTLNTTDTYLTGVFYNDIACTKTDDGYSFTMPEGRAIITAETATYTEVLQNGFATFSDKNYKMIAMNAKHNSANASEWALTVDMSSNYMSTLKSEIISSDPSVIPEDAIKVVPYSKKDLGISGTNDFEIVQAKVIVDTSKIKTGSSWLVMNFANGNTSDKTRLAVNMYVCEYGQFPVQTMGETLVIDVSQVESGAQSYNIRVADADHIDGSKLKAFQDFTVSSVDGKLRVPIDYAKGHSYWVRISVGGGDDYQTSLRIEANQTEGATYTGDTTMGGEGRLTFTEANVEFHLVVTDNA